MGLHKEMLLGGRFFTDLFYPQSIGPTCIQPCRHRCVLRLTKQTDHVLHHHEAMTLPNMVEREVGTWEKMILKREAPHIFGKKILP